MNNPKVSIILTFYNQERYIKDALDSVISNSFKDWECIIIDDGSDDSSSEVVMNIVKNYDKVRYIKQKNQGVCKARNNAINSSLGEYILCLDADDKISNDYIRLCVEALDGDSKVALVTTNYEYFGDKKGLVELEKYSIEKLMWRNLFINCSMFRRSDYIRVGGFNENMYEGLEDWDFWLAILKNGGKVRYVKGVHFYYRQYSNYQSRNNKAMQDRPRLVMKIRKNHSELYLNTYSSAIYSYEYLSICKSKEYIIGKYLLLPIRFILSLLKINK